MVGITFHEKRRLCGSSQGSGEDHVEAHAGRDGGRDPAPFPPGRPGQMAVRPPSAAMTAPVT